MSEVASRPSASRGRGSGRGSRGGFAGRGGRTGRTSSRTNGDSQDLKHENIGAFEDEGEFGELRKLYGSKTSVIREMFPDWSEADVLFALQETNGDENEAVARIAEGTISQWGQVSNNKKAARQKAKESSPPPSNNKFSPGDVRHPSRGGRAVSEGARGRGRGSERGGRGGAGRGRPVQAASNDPVKSIPTEDAFSWDTQDDFSWDSPIANENTESQKIPVAGIPVVEIPVAEKSAPVEMPQPGAPKTWASMLRQTTTPKPVVPKKVPAPKPALPTLEDAESNGPEVAEPAEEETTPVAQHAVPAQDPVFSEPDAVLPPPDDLTETNLEQVVDVSNPPATDTARSTTADSWDPRQSPVSSSATPISAAHQQHQTDRSAASSGFATSALKATAERSARVPSLQRRVLDQEEPVRMPGNREVDRAAVKFGAFSLNDGEEDVDGEREEPETRAQPPAESPVAHPRASLPPVSHPVAVPEAFPQKPAGVPSATPGTVPTAPAAAQAPAAHVQQQYGRFGPADSAATTATAHVQKPVGPFHNGAQTAPVTQPPFDSYSVPTSQPQVQGQQPGAAFTSAPSEYSNYYTASHQERTPYNAYAQQQYGAHGQHDGASQQRPFAGYNAADNLSQYPQSGSLHNQPRFGGSSDSQNSGHSTPNPAVQAQQHGQHGGQQGQQGQQSQQAQQGVPGSQPQTHGQYPGYSHPYYSNPYYHQYYSGYGQGGFGPYGGKGGMYGQPYGMSPNAPYDHSSSPSTFAGAPSSLHRDSSLSSGLGEYGRSASGQTGGQPASSSGFGGAHDSYARGSSALQSQGQSYNSQNQAPASGSADELKPFGDGKTNASGPSPSLGGGPRPGSAANNAPSGQSGLPPQNSQIGSGGYGGYPSHLQGHNVHGSGYGMGGAGGGSQHGSSPYGNYGQGFGSGGYYGGGQQQRGGWGGNYH
ncbi:hypothetical protein E4U09_001243 [Claviceps aff. purpurea]|uniref:RNA polymerase II degradation factor 1 n=1 Tax=Claviceps aff. purpurea TaxID=1967640 RepID=A0A9P7QJS1_9HYPO|nr:hypothetical protein E4U09_001243 [Claviceps aff. purpurea]